MLEHLEQAGDLRELLEAVLGEQPGGALHEEVVLRGLLELGERGRQRAEELALARRQDRVVELRQQHPRAHVHVPERLVEVAGRPREQTAVDGLVVRDHALGHAAGGGDDHDHRHLRLEQQHLDAVDRGRLDRRGRDEREQVRHLRELLGGGAHGVVDLAAHGAQLQAPARDGQPAHRKQLVRVEAVAAIGRHATRPRCAGARAARSPPGGPVRRARSTVPRARRPARRSTWSRPAGPSPRGPGPACAG